MDKGGNLIKSKWFGTYDEPPVRQQNDRFIVSWDSALSAKDLASYSVGIVLQVRGDEIYVLDAVRERLEYPDLKRRVIELHKRWNIGSRYALLIENKGSGMALIQELKRDNKIYAQEVDPQGDKVVRMHAQTARMEARGIFLPRQAHWLDEFRKEILSFPSSRHNDQVDAFSQGLDEAYNPQRRGESAQGFALGLLY